MAEDKRKSISKRVRFEVFKRDNFTCQYCSAKPPNVPLEIDHIIPVSKGGKNNVDNLLTACFDCNRGKSNIELDNVPKTLTDKTEVIKLAQYQYKQYCRVLKKQEKIINDDIQTIQLIFELYHNEWSFTDKFKLSVKKFIESLGIHEVKDSMEKACLKNNLDSDDTLRYFCGICWNKIKGN